jgi:hypothetical protein
LCWPFFHALPGFSCLFIFAIFDRLFLFLRSLTGCDYFYHASRRCRKCISLPPWDNRRYSNSVTGAIPNIQCGIHAKFWPDIKPDRISDLRGNVADQAKSSIAQDFHCPLNWPKIPDFETKFSRFESNRSLEIGPWDGLRAVDGLNSQLGQIHASRLIYISKKYPFMSNPMMDAFRFEIGSFIFATSGMR